MDLLFEISRKGRSACTLPHLDVPPAKEVLPSSMLREELSLPELSEVDVVRHFTHLSQRNFGVDQGFYPLGSCTMKYNPKINEDMAALAGFNIHPYTPPAYAQGCVQILYELERYLCEITGMDSCSMQPAAGAHGELTAVMVMKAYFKDRGEKRRIMLIPDSAHGTNPASVALCGFSVVQVKSDTEGGLDIEDLKAKMSDQVVGIMITNPNTLGLFEKNILEISRIVHEQGGILYCDGANTNASMGIVRAGDLGFDVIHLNLHKSFSTPHGGGGPGSGPICVKKHLEKYLPNPRVVKKGDEYSFADVAGSIGRVKAFYGNFGVMVRAYTYIRSLGASGLRAASETAVLNANYMRVKLMKEFDLPIKRMCQHEFVLSDAGMPNGVTTNDIAKRLLDYGFHPPTIYFPLIVHGAIMIEPTETESLETMDSFIETMVKIKKEAASDPEMVKSAPHTTVVSKLDAVKAAREPRLRWTR